LTEQIFFRLLDRDCSVKEFEQWIYSHSDNLGKELSTHLHLDLISSDYNQKDSFSQLIEKIAPYINTDEFNIWRTKKLLTEIIEEKIDIVTATRKLRDLYFETGENFIPVTLGIGYESELDDVPTPSEYNQWDSNGLQEKLKKVEWYKDDIIRDAKKILATLGH
jgi:hypothetical protein